MDETFMRRAIELSRQATGRPFGSVIVKDGRIVAEGTNQVDDRCDPTWHAEMEAIRNACQSLGTLDLSGCTIYASSEPCPMCACAISWARLDALVYGAPANEARRWEGYPYPHTAEQAALPALQRVLPARQVLADVALAALKRG